MQGCLPLAGWYATESGPSLLVLPVGGRLDSSLCRLHVFRARAFVSRDDVKRHLHLLQLPAKFQTV